MIHKEQVKLKIKFIEDSIKCEEETYKTNKGMIKPILILGTIALILEVTIFSFIKTNLGAMDVLSISLLLCALYKLGFDYLDGRHEHIRKIGHLKIDKAYYKDILTLLEKYEEEELYER